MPAKKDKDLEENVEDKNLEDAENVDSADDKADEKANEMESTNNTTKDEETVEDETESIDKVTCIFLINVKYNKEVKKIGESIVLPKEEAEFLEENEVLQIVR